MRSLTDTIALASRGNQEARFYLAGLYHAIDLWDDLIDKDEKIEDSRVHRVFEFLLYYLPLNSFYLDNLETLLPVTRNCITAWHTANAQKKTNIEQSYILRQCYFDLVATVASLLGGLEFGKTIHLELWKMSAEVSSLESYKEKYNGILGT